MDDFALELYRLPLDELDLNEITTLLQSEEVFTLSFVPGEEDIYNPITYHRQILHHETKTTLFVDRNVITRWVSLVRGINDDLKQQQKAAAVMAFAQCADLLIEPNISFHEYASTRGNAAANEDLRFFRIADHVHPQNWAEMALGRSASLQWSYEDLPPLPSEAFYDFAKPLRLWRRNYILALKIAELVLGGHDVEQTLNRFLHWMYDDFKFGGPALILGVHYLCQPRREQKKLFKNLYASDREAALYGVRNAAWDLTMLSQWLQHIQTQNERNMLTILCSFDKQLNKLARILCPPNAGELTDAELRERMFCSLLGSDLGSRISSIASSYFASLDEPTRQLHRSVNADFIDDLIVHGEALVRKYMPA